MFQVTLFRTLAIILIGVMFYLNILYVIGKCEKINLRLRRKSVVNTPKNINVLVVMLYFFALVVGTFLFIYIITFIFD